MTEPGDCECKVGQVAERFGLTELDDTLIHRHRDGASLRDLADYVNRAILREALDQTDGDGFDEGDRLFGAIEADDALEAIFGVLTDEDVSAERRARVRTRLGQAGVDVDSVESAWVTHPTVRSHLRQCLDIDTSSSPSLSTEDGIDTVQWGITRCRGVVDGTIRRLRTADQLSITDPEVDVTVRITCVECGETYTPTELLSEGVCACNDAL